MDRELSIVGGGVAGLATALRARAAGIDVCVFERAVEFGAVGHAMLLLPNGLSVLESLGVGSDVRAFGERIERALVRAPTGQVVMDSGLPDTVCITRRDLVEALRRALPADAVRTGHALESVDTNENEDAVSLRFQSGASIRSRFVIGADGFRSKLRSQLFPGHAPVPIGVHELVCLTQSPDIAREFAGTFLKFQAEEGGLAAGVIPTGAGRVVWYVQFDAGRFTFDEARAENRRAFAERCVGHWPSPLPRLIEETDFERTHIWRTADMDPLPSYAAGNVLLIGDAAHPLLSFTSQGANAALEDAVAVGVHVLPVLGDATERNIGIRAYEEQRRKVMYSHLLKGRVKAERFLREGGLSSEVSLVLRTDPPARS